MTNNIDLIGSPPLSGEGLITSRYEKQDVDFIAEVYHSVARGEGVEQVIADYAAHFPDIRFSWQAVCLEGQHYHAVRAFNYDDGAFDDYMPIAHLNMIPGLGAQLPIGSVVKSEHFLPQARYEMTDIYDLFFRERDELNRSRGLWAYRQGTDVAYLGVDIPKRYPESEREQLDASLAVILPHIQRAFALMLDLDIRRGRQEQAKLWLDALPCAAFVLTGEGKVSHSNESAERLCHADIGFRMGSGDKLELTGTDLNDALTERIRRTALTLDAEGPFALPCANRRLSGYCVAMPAGFQLDAVMSYFGGSQRETLLVVVDADEPPPRDSQLISEMLRLTPAEGNLIELLCAGEDVRSAARMLQISYNTARNQVASATERLGLRRQTELVSAAVGTLGQLNGLPGYRRRLDNK